MMSVLAASIDAMKFALKSTSIDSVTESDRFLRVLGILGKVDV